MPANPAAYRAHLATGSTTRARCWKITRRDGLVLGFTDHDRPIAFDGVTFEPTSAVSASEASASLGLAPDEAEVAGALTSAAITEADLARGLYAGAAVEVWDVNWADPDARRLAGLYEVGEVERRENAFRAEIRSRAAALQRKLGRVLLPACDAELGDARCGVDVSGPPFLEAGTVASADDLTITAAEAGLAAAGSDFFTRGLLTWTSGANAGTTSAVRRHVQATDTAVLDIWRAPAFDIAPGDGFTLRAGCDKSWGACVVKFGNGPNHRGFPHIPSEYFAAAYARTGDPAQDGGSQNPPPSINAAIYVRQAPTSEPET